MTTTTDYTKQANDFLAKTVVKFKKVSEKQAYIIARAYAENNGY